MRKIFNNKGTATVVVTGAIVTILGMTALVTDIGTTIYEKQKLSNAVDAATLAGMQEINKDDETIINIVKQYAELNGLDPSKIDILINPNRKSITVNANKDVNYFFAKAIGIKKSIVENQTEAKVSPISSYKGVRPLAIANQELQFNTLYTLKEDSGDGLSGNYGAMALGGNGAGVYRDNLLYGYPATLKIGDIVFTETGNITQATKDGIQSLMSSDPNSTYDNFDKSSKRLIVLPIVNTLDVNGKKPVTIVGFAAFFLEGTLGSGGQTSIVGRFVKYVASGDASDYQTDYGLKAIKITN